MTKFADAVAYNQKRWESGAITFEHLTALVLAYQQSRSDLEDDGKAGPLTVNTLDELLLPSSVPFDGVWDAWDGPASSQPRSRAEVYQMFGDPGKQAADKAWAKANIVECHKSHGNQLPGVPAKWYVHVHNTIEPYLREALRRAQASAPDYVIERIAGYVWRPIRHKIGNPLSMHSWGVAIDIDPQKNFSKTFAKGQTPEAWSERWTQIWPDGLPEGFVRAFQSCGFAWGADWDEDGLSYDHEFIDPMHFEWVDRSDAEGGNEV